jgi:hypothetical protein
MSLKEEPFLPISTKPQSKFRVRQLLGHCLYRRVVVWALVIVVLVSFTLFNSRIPHRSHNVLDLVQLGKGEMPSTTVTNKVDNSPLQKQDAANIGTEQPKPIQEDSKVEKQELASIKSNEKNKEIAKEENKGKKKLSGPHWLEYKQ